MKAFPIVRSLTLVSVLLFSVVGWTESKEDCLRPKIVACIAACKPEVSNCKSDCRLEEQYGECLALETREQERAKLSEARSENKEEKSSCSTMQTSVLKSFEEIKKQCGYTGISNTAKCQENADACHKGLNPTTEGDESEDDTERAMKILWGLNGPGLSSPYGSGQPGSCTILDDEKESDKQDRAIEKMSKLKADIASLKEDIAKAEDDVAKKKQDVEEKIVEIEKDMDKKKNDKKTDEQKEIAKSQQDALDAIKRKKGALKTIEEKNRLIGSLRLQQQEEAIKFSQSNLMKACRDQAMELKTKMITAAYAPGATKGTAASGQIRKDVETFAKQCVKLAAVEKTKAMKATQDRITMENSNIKELQDAVKLDDQAAGNRLKDLEARKKLATEDMTKAEERRSQELIQLNQKVMDMQTLVEKKKATLAEKINAKLEEIKAVELKMQDKKARFSEVSSKISASKDSVTGFVNECCEYKDLKGRQTYQALCLRLKTDYPTEAASVKSSKTKSGAKK